MRRVSLTSRDSQSASAPENLPLALLTLALSERIVAAGVAESVLAGGCSGRQAAARVPQPPTAPTLTSPVS
jgi:hypothetical protein